MSIKSIPKDQLVRSLERGLAVIEVFGQGRQAMTLSDVARHAKVSRAAARRLLYTLVTLGYAAFDGKHFELRPRVLGLGFAYMSSMDVWDVAQPFLEDLVRETRESCSVSVLDGMEIVHVVRLPAAERLMSIAVKVGDRLPAYASAMGRVQLAALPDTALDRYFADAQISAVTEKTVTDEKKLRVILAQVRKQGYAEVDGELEIGLRALAVPISDRTGRVVASIALSTLSSQVTRRGAANPLLAPLQGCAMRIRQALSRLA